MRPLPQIITLLTDFGTQDYFVGAMKGAILSINPSAHVVDISHDIPPQDIELAAFNLLACYRDFPEGAIHVAVIDPGVGSNRHALAIECAQRFFVGPDNGLFSWICEREGNYRAVSLKNERFFRQPVSETFHGRDIFAPVAAALSAGTAIEELGEPVKNIVRLALLTPTMLNPQTIEGRIIHIDRFGNCVTNFTTDHVRKEMFAADARLTINGQEVISFSRFFAEAKDDSELFCLFGSAGFLEIAAQNSSAQQILNAQRGDSVQLLFASVP